MVHQLTIIQTHISTNEVRVPFPHLCILMNAQLAAADADVVVAAAAAAAVERQTRRHIF